MLKSEKIAKIGAGFIEDSFGLRFTTIVVSANIIESAVSATMKIGVAEGTKFLPADEAFQWNFFLTVVTYFHRGKYIDIIGNNQEKSRNLFSSSNPVDWIKLGYIELPMSSYDLLFSHFVKSVLTFHCRKEEKKGLSVPCVVAAFS